MAVSALESFSNPYNKYGQTLSVQVGLTPTSAMSTEALQALFLLKSLHQQRCELIPAQLSLLPGQRRHQLPASTPEQHNHRAAKSKHNFCFVSQVVFCFSGFFNLQETFIHVKLYRNNFPFTAPAKSLPVTKSHLCKAVGFIPINLLLQKSVGGWAEPIPAEMRALSGPGCTPENTKSINTEQHFAYFTLCSCCSTKGAMITLPS